MVGFRGLVYHEGGSQVNFDEVRELQDWLLLLKENASISGPEMREMFGMLDRDAFRQDERRLLLEQSVHARRNLLSIVKQLS